MAKWLKPTVDTKFAIDMRWWERKGNSFRSHLRDALCPECRATFNSLQQAGDTDWVDPQTGEVTRWRSLHCHPIADALLEMSFGVR